MTSCRPASSGPVPLAISPVGDRADHHPPRRRSSMTCRYRCHDACSRAVPNTSDNETFAEVVAGTLSRRGLLKAAVVLGAVGAATTLPGATTPAAATTGTAPRGAPSPVAAQAGPRLAFTPVPPNTEDVLRVPGGYQQGVVVRWGDPVVPGAPAFDLGNQTGEAQAQQWGFNNDYLTLLPMAGDPMRALLVANHEYATEPTMIPGYDPANPTRRHVDVGLAAHGMSVLMVSRDPASGRLTPVMDRLNRRITATTPMEITGPAAGHDLLRTSADPTGRRVLGTLNNCAGGTTPWDTVLTGEENVDMYFAHGEQVADEATKEALERYGMDGGATDRLWEKFEPRFDLLQEPHEPNRFGWVVEVDPFDPESVPRKRTALGRMKHEGAAPRVMRNGATVVYMGDDQEFEYVYKFVSARKHHPGHSRAARANNARLLDEGTLYVARFSGDRPTEHAAPGEDDFDGRGEWIPMVRSRSRGRATSYVEGMTGAEVLIHTRQAADIAGGTKMDRPEDVQPHPHTGRVYVALTNNEDRGTPGEAGTDRANPRPENKNGQVLEFAEVGDDPTAQQFNWRLMLICGDPASEDTYFAGFPKDQVSPISCPDNVAFDPTGNLWIATDGNALDSNDGLFAVAVEGPARGQVKQFLTVPKGAETCGPVIEESMVMVAVQHPGEADGATADRPASQWPDREVPVPRPAVVTVWREDGAPIGA